MSDPTRKEAVSFQAAAPGTISGLQLALIARMKLLAAALWDLPTKTGADADDVPVHFGWLPPVKSGDAPRFPYLLVRPHGGEDSIPGGQQTASAAFDIIIGVYTDTDDGEQDLLHVIDAIRIDLAAAPELADTAYSHTGPLTWDLITDADPRRSTRPEWLAVVTTNWTLPRPRRVEARNPEATE